MCFFQRWSDTSDIFIAGGGFQSQPTCTLVVLAPVIAAWRVLLAARAFCRLTNLALAYRSTFARRGMQFAADLQLPPCCLISSATGFKYTRLWLASTVKHWLP